MFERSSVKKFYDECDALKAILEYRPEDYPEDYLERRYKIVVTAILPILLLRTNLILFSTNLLLGLAFAYMFFR